MKVSFIAVHLGNVACLSRFLGALQHVDCHCRDVAAVLSAPETGQSVASALRSLEASIEANVEAR